MELRHSIFLLQTRTEKSPKPLIMVKKHGTSTMKYCVILNTETKENPSLKHVHSTEPSLKIQTIIWESNTIS